MSFRRLIRYIEVNFLFPLVVFSKTFNHTNFLRVFLDFFGLEMCFNELSKTNLVPYNTEQSFQP